MVKLIQPLLFIFLMAGSAMMQAQEDQFYKIVSIPTPEGVPFEVSGLEALPDGRLVAAIRKGELWLIENAYARDPGQVRFKRIASALHEPLGVLWHGDSLYVAQRGELTRLRDTNGDDVVDEYLTVCNDWGITANYHEYAYGPKLDRNGHFWVTLNSTLGNKFATNDAWRGWGVRIEPSGKMIPECAGMRSPAGLGANAEGDMFFTDQQGNWVPTGTLHHLRTGAFYGHVDSLKSCALPGSPLPHPGPVPTGKLMPEAARELPVLKLPTVWFPYRKMGMSATDVVCDMTGGRFGPFAGQLFVGDFTMALVNRVFLEKVNGEYQGACFPFRKGFQSAVVRMAFGKNGSLFVGQTNRGWNSLGHRSYGLERLEWTGQLPFEIREMRARKDGFDLVFTEPVNAAEASQASAYTMSSYTYIYRGDYGGPESDAKNLSIQSASVSGDGLRVTLTVNGLREGYVHELLVTNLTSASGQPLLHKDAYYTLNQLPR